MSCHFLLHETTLSYHLEFSLLFLGYTESELGPQPMSEMAVLIMSKGRLSFPVLLVCKVGVFSPLQSEGRALPPPTLDGWASDFHGAHRSNLNLGVRP